MKILLYLVPAVIVGGAAAVLIAQTLRYVALNL